MRTTERNRLIFPELYQAVTIDKNDSNRGCFLQPVDANLPMTNLAKVMRFRDKRPQRRLFGVLAEFFVGGQKLKNPRGAGFRGTSKEM
jgi:hypothetical protein